ncbi:MAG: phosphotransferase [Mariprofundus sp.]|nr:phosphotransferase [Mariprofundus sp.]
MAELRRKARERWLHTLLGADVIVASLAGDASFRCYYRVTCAGCDYVLMDAPPPHEDVSPFMAVRAWFDEAGLRVSKLYGADIEQGFLLLEDFGDLTWAVALQKGVDIAPLFTDALRQLHLLQASTPSLELAPFDVERMQCECALYLDWYLPRVVSLAPDAMQREQFLAVLANRLSVIESLPRVAVHLDYHSRNLMLAKGQLPLGQIDYQDAVMGPVTYDLASLLYDCYQDYPEEVRLYWSRRFYESLPKAIAVAFAHFDDWHYKLRLTAMQRHIKAIGIFARLAHRDGKQQFLTEIPLTRKHLLEELAFLGITATMSPLLFAGPEMGLD